MKKNYLKLTCLLSVIFIFAFKDLRAQVKIGGTPGAPHSSAILQLDDTSRGLLLPVLTGIQRNAIGNPQPGLLLYNSTENALNLYRQNNWQTVYTGIPEWQFDTSRKWIYLARPLPMSDSIYYDTTRHKFLFTDRPTYTNSINQDIPIGNFGGKFIFKATASKSQDSIQLQASAMYTVYEVDSASTTYNDSYTALNTLTTVNPKAGQKPFAVTGIINNALHAGNDTTFRLTGISNTTYPNGKGFTQELTGIENWVRLGSADTGYVGNAYGIYNIAIRNATATGRIRGNLFGYYNVLTGSITTRTDGSAYGIFLGNISGAATGNYAIYTNQGRNRFGDSSIFGAGIVPRAFVDINNPTSMIVPTGAALNRPATGVTGMLRYNTDNGGTLETYNGTQWVGTLRSTVSIDLPLITPGTGYTASFTLNGATLGSSVSVSPTNALDNGLIIAWARVSGPNTIEVRFNLLYGTAIDPAAQNYYVRVFQ